MDRGRGVCDGSDVLSMVYYYEIMMTIIMIIMICVCVFLHLWYNAYLILSILSIFVFGCFFFLGGRPRDRH